MRFKNRYLLAELAWEDGRVDEALSARELGSALGRAVLEAFGEHGYGMVQSSLQVKYLNSRTGLFIVRVARGHQDKLTGACFYLTELRRRAVAVRSVHLGGTIRSCKIRALERLREAALLAPPPAGPGPSPAGKRKREAALADGEEEEIMALEP